MKEKMNLFSFSHKILIANKSCIATRPSWKTWSNSKTVHIWGPDEKIKDESSFVPQVQTTKQEPMEDS